MISRLGWIAWNALVICGVLLYGFWVSLPHFCGDVEDLLAAQTPARTYYDGRGRVLLREPTYDGQWRLDVPLERMSPAVKRVMQGAEDGEFYAHDGVDRRAIMRALWLNLRRGRIKSGASTITMQLVGLAIGRDRTWGRKFRQAGLARRLEWLHGKHWIFEQYLNRIPFGGKLYGIEAASWYYFGLPASKLNMAEASLLCGLPQRPNGYRPDRHLPRARRRQRLVLRQLVLAGALTHEEGREILLREPLRFRDFRVPSPLRSSFYRRTDHFLQLALREANGAFQVRTSWDPQLQEILLNALRQQVRRLERVEDGAGVVIDNATGEVLALVGTLDYDNPRAGQVNAAVCRRNAGSTLKPFIYAEAVDGGLLCGSTILEDRPFQYGGYAPGNDSGTYAGRVSATTALSQSLNTPAIRLVARLGERRVLQALCKLGIVHRGYLGVGADASRRLGLSVGLGTCGARLLDLAGAYRYLGSVGRDSRVTFLKAGLNGKGTGDRVFSPGACAMVSQMLSSRAMPGGIVEAAWKTGTSTGNRDAWCLAYTPDYTVGIWLGNKDGRGASSLVGGQVAAPCAAAVLEWLYRDRTPSMFPTEGLLEEERLCARTGLRARPGSCHVVWGKKVVGIPLRECDGCVRGMRPKVQILRPVAGTYVAGRSGRVRLRIMAVPERVHWYVDDRYCGSLTGGYLSFGIGRHSLRAVSQAGDMQPEVVNIEVVPSNRR